MTNSLSRTRSPSGTRRASAKARLRQALCDEVDGKRTCVLVLGEGLNKQAAGVRGAKRRSEWYRVLDMIWREAGGTPREFGSLEQTTATLWAAIVRQWSSYHGTTRKRSLSLVAAKLCKHLESIESDVVRRRLYSKLLDGRFANLVSFNVDRRFTLQSGATRIIKRRERESPLFRHVEVTGLHGRTNVWFPYGDTSRASSIELDHSFYDYRLMQLEERRASLMDENYKWDYGYGPGLRPPISVWPSLWHAPSSWCDLVLCAPLVFIGTSLPTDDWPLWWLLHQRARYFVPFKEWQVAETFYLTSNKTESNHIENGTAGIELVRFKDNAALWKFVLAAIDAPGVDQHRGWDRRFGC